LRHCVRRALAASMLLVVYAFFCYCVLHVASLQTEVYELRQSIQILKEKQRCSELALCRLHKTRSRLECEIAGKASTIHIDSEFCLKLRDSRMLDARAGPVYDMRVEAESGANNINCKPKITQLVGPACERGLASFTGVPCCL